MKKIILILALALGVNVNAQIVGGFMPKTSSQTFSAGNATFSNVIAKGTLSVTGTSSLVGNALFSNSVGIGALPTSSLSSFAVVKGTASINIGSHSANVSNIWVGMSAPNSTNYAVQCDGVDNIVNAFNGRTFLDLRAGGNTVMRVESGKAALTGSLTVSSTATVSGNLSLPHIIGNSLVPAIARGTGLGTGAGTVVSVTNATDLSGIIGLVTGTAALGTGAVIAALTFTSAYGVAPNVAIFPANAAAANLIIGTNPYAASSTATMGLISNTVALPASTTYSFFYHVIQ